MEYLRVSQWSTGIHDIKPIESDLIEIDKGFYSHWIICIGPGEVLHMTGANGEKPTSYVLKMEGLSPILLHKQSIQETIEQYPWRINNKPELNRRPKSLSAIRNLIRIFFENQNELFYNIKYFNCEHFVTFLKYGILHCSQTNFVKSTAANSLLHAPIHIGLQLFSDWVNNKPQHDFKSNILKPLERAVVTGTLQQLASETLIKSSIQEKFVEFLSRYGVLHEATFLEKTAPSFESQHTYDYFKQSHNFAPC